MLRAELRLVSWSLAWLACCGSPPPPVHVADDGGVEIAEDSGAEIDPGTVAADAVAEVADAGADAGAGADAPVVDAMDSVSPLQDIFPDVPLPSCPCESDADCAPGDRCTFWHVCKPMNLEPGQCWDVDCPMGFECAGMVVCSCDGACLEPDHPGVCTSLGATCCTSSAMCPLAEECTAAGRCKPTYDPSVACWTHAGCPSGFRCDDSSVCPCGYACFLGDWNGVCVPLADGCCAKDADCPPGDVCAVLPNSTHGRCASAPAAGACFGAADCTGGVCKGAVLSTCVQPLPGPPVAGACE